MRRERQQEGSGRGRSTPQPADAMKAKKLHDLLALATLLDENVCLLGEVEVSANGDGHWGSELCEGTGTFGAVDFCKDSFFNTLFEML
mmetsp:Transcript_15368/g.31401  ORF Transcript_15368/g.31401 Transcript_15368/m.31401 type:complete len:88 (+) Transcript_15368:1012-1275(+)